MSYFPFFVDIQGKKCVVVGGGSVAYRKARRLLSFGAEVFVAAPAFCSAMTDFYNRNKDAGMLFLEERVFSASVLDDAFLVIAATDDTMLNHEISRLCRERHIPVNTVDQKEDCDFFFPSVVKREEIVVGCSTGGQSPVIASRIREIIADAVPKYYAVLNERLGEIREEVKERIPSYEGRKQFYETLVKQSEALGRAVTMEEIEEKMKEVCDD